jgi:hypothetical protein
MYACMQMCVYGLFHKEQLLSIYQFSYLCDNKFVICYLFIFWLASDEVCNLSPLPLGAFMSWSVYYEILCRDRRGKVTLYDRLLLHRDGYVYLFKPEREGERGG